MMSIPGVKTGSLELPSTGKGRSSSRSRSRSKGRQAQAPAAEPDDGFTPE